MDVLFSCYLSIFHYFNLKNWLSYYCLYCHCQKVLTLFVNFSNLICWIVIGRKCGLVSWVHSICVFSNVAHDCQCLVLVTGSCSSRTVLWPAWSNWKRLESVECHRSVHLCLKCGLLWYFANLCNDINIFGWLLAWNWFCLLLDYHTFVFKFNLLLVFLTSNFYVTSQANTFCWVLAWSNWAYLNIWNIT